MSKIAAKTLRTSKGTVQVGESFPTGLPKKEMDAIVAIGGMVDGVPEHGATGTVDTEAFNEAQAMLDNAQKQLAEDQTTLTTSQKKLAEDIALLTTGQKELTDAGSTFSDLVTERAEAMRDLADRLLVVADKAAVVKTEAEGKELKSLIEDIRKDIDTLTPKAD
jgi:uncharacterized protein involved in exopolysaccharide biosynthesis